MSHVNTTMHSALDNMYISHVAKKELQASTLFKRAQDRGREREREDGREGRRDRVANSRYYVGSFRRESIWQIGQSLRGQNFSSGCDDGVEMRLLVRGGGVGLYQDGGRRDGVRKLFRRVHFLPD